MTGENGSDIITAIGYNINIGVEYSLELTD